MAPVLTRPSGRDIPGQEPLRRSTSITRGPSRTVDEGQAIATPYPTRTPKPGPEARLVELALSMRLAVDPRYSRYVMREPRLPTGNPDLVFVYFSRRVSVLRTRPSLSERHLRLLYNLMTAGPRRPDELAGVLGERRRLHADLESLFAAGLLTLRHDLLVPVRLQKNFVAKRIIAVEAKVSDWRKAIQQAWANTWFASDSYVLLPDRPTFASVVPFAARAGVGILAAVEGSPPRIVLAAKRMRIPASYGSLLVNEWLLQARAGETG